MKSLKAGIGGVQGTEVLLHDLGDTRSSPHLSMVALGCLDKGDERGWVATRVDSAQGQAWMLQQDRILRDETRASQSAANKGTLQNWNNKGEGY
jgi:hypothetical protein